MLLPGIDRRFRVRNGVKHTVACSDDKSGGKLWLVH